MRLIVASDGLALEAVAGSAREIVADKLSQVAGVGDVEICGPEDETRITVSLDALAASGRTFEDVRNAVVSASLPSANVGAGSQKLSTAPAFADVPILRDTARVESDATVSRCVARGVNRARVLGVTVIAQVGADPLEVRERVEAMVPKLRAELPAMRVFSWPRTRPLGFEIALNPTMPAAARISRLEEVIGELDQELSTQFVLELGLPDHDPDVADLRIVPPVEHGEDVDAKVAAVLERHRLAMLGRHDHIVGFSGADPAALRKHASTLVTALAAANDLHVVEEIGVEQQPRKTAKVDRDRAAALGITPGTIDTTLAVLAPGGMRVSTTFTQHAQAPVMLAVDGGWDLASALDRVMVRSTTGSLVPLSAVVTIAETPEADVILHEGQFPWVGLRVAGPIAALNDVLAKLPVPTDITPDVREPD